MKHLPYLSMLLVSTSLLFCCFVATAQVDVQWDKTFGREYGDYLYSVINTPDGGYLIGGVSQDSEPQHWIEDYYVNDFWIIKVDAEGNKQWDKIFDRGLANDFRSAIATSDGGYMLGGTSFEDNICDAGRDESIPCTEDWDFWIVKIDADGNKIWDKTFGGSGYEGLEEIVPAADGGYLLAGMSYADTTGTEYDYWIVKIDEDGNELWDKTIGGDDYDRLTNAVSSPDGGYLLAGTSNSDASGDKSEDRRGSCNEYGFCTSDYWVVKIDENGNKQWDRTLGGGESEGLSGVISTPDGGYLLAGGSQSNESGDKTLDETGQWIVKIAENGDKLWEAVLDINRMTITDVIHGIDEGFLIAGYTDANASGDKSENSKGGEDYWIIKIDDNGNKLWDKIIGGSFRDYLRSVVATDGGYLLAGHSSSNASGDKSEDKIGGGQWPDYWIIKVVETEAGEAFSIRSLSLVNADTDQVLFSLQDGAEINLSDLGNPQLTVRANTMPINVERVSFELDGPITHAQTENHWPYALFGDDPKAGSGRDYLGRQWEPGEYTLTVTPYLEGRAGRAVSISFEVVDDVSSSVPYFVLVNADTDQDIRRLTDGDVIDLQALGNPQLSIRANTNPIAIDRIELVLSGPFMHTQTEMNWPYALFGDNAKAGPGRDYIGRDWQRGAYTLTATPYHHDRSGATATISFSITGNNAARLAVEVYPVPTQGDITISHEGITEDANMMLMDFSGNVLLEKPLSRQSEEQLNLTHLRKGIYYLKKVEAETVETKKIVLE